MAYQCNYDIVYKKDSEGFKDQDKTGVARIRGGACFRQGWDDLRKKDYGVESFVVYVLKDYSKVDYTSDDNKMEFTAEEIYRYARYLRRMGFKFVVSETSIKYIKNDPDEKAHPCYAFTIPANKHSEVGNKFLMTAIRYLYENPYQIVPRTFLRLAKQRSNISYWNLFIICNFSAYIGDGHSIPSNYTKFLRLFNKTEVNYFITKSAASSIQEGNELFGYYGKYTGDNIKEFHSFITDEKNTVEDIYNLYISQHKNLKPIKEKEDAKQTA